MLFAGTVANFLDLKTHGTVTFFCLLPGFAIFYILLPRVKELWNA